MKKDLHYKDIVKMFMYLPYLYVGFTPHVTVSHASKNG